MNGQATHGVWIAVSPKGVGGLGDLLSGAGGAGSAAKTIQTPKPALVTSVKVISPAPMPYQPPTAPNAYSPPISEGPTSELEDGEPIKLPESLESLPKSDNFPTQRHRWNTNEEIASMLIAFDKHHEWMSKEVKIRPKSGSMLLYSRKKVRYRRDGYCWKKRKDGKTTREDHMKLKVQGMECIYGCYVHSAILPTFHRRCYWLLQNPDIVLVHYLNVPYPDDNKMLVTNSVSLWGDKKEWTKEELVSQIKPMFYSEEETDLKSELEVSTAETVETIVVQLMEKQRTARTLGHIECACPDSTCLDGKNCVHQIKQEVHNIPHPRSRSGRGGAGGGGLGGGGNNHTRLMESTNQFFETDPRFYPECTTYSQVSSTTGNHGLLVQATRERHSPGSGHSTPSRGHTPLVFSLTQLQGNGGLVVLNSNSGPTSTTPSMSPYGGGARQITPPVSDTPSPRPLLTSCETPDIGSATRGEVGSVSAAVNTLTNIHEFSLDLDNGNYDSSYSGLHSGLQSGLQPVTDSLLSGPESKKSDDDSNKSDSEGGPLLDFKSAFSDLDNKNDMSFLHETLDMSHDDIHRTLSANLPSCEQEKVNGPSAGPNHLQNGHGGHPGGHQMEYQDHNSHHQQHHQSHQQHQPSHHHNSFDVNLDAFDILSDFPELSHYEAGVSGGLMHNNGNQSPMLSQSTGSGIALNGNNHIGGSIKARTLEYRENLVAISDYSPGWAYTNGDEKVLVTGPWYSQSAAYQILFNGSPVTTTLVQSGVLRCYAPAHEEGEVELQVACDGYIVSQSVIFNYKANPIKKPVNHATVTETETNLDHATTDDTTATTNITTTICNANTNHQQLKEPINVSMSSDVPITSQSHQLSMDFASCLKNQINGGQINNVFDRFFAESLNVVGSAGVGAPTSAAPLVGVDNNDLKYRLLNKLEELGICSIEDMQQMYKENFSDFEDQAVTMCQKLTTAKWGKAGDEDNENGVNTETNSDCDGSVDRQESILHLAASLGLSRLVCSLLHWAAEHPGKQIGMEVDALALDKNGFTPLMRACHQGNKEVATILYHWNSAAATIKNKRGQTCAEVAGASSCPEFRLELERMEAIKRKETFHSLARGNSTEDAFVKPEGRRITKSVVRAPSLEEHLTVPGTSSRSPSPGFRSVSMNVRSLRGGSPAASCSSFAAVNSMQMESNQRKYGLNKRPSVDSGINIDMAAAQHRTARQHNQTGKHTRQLSKEDRSLSLPSSGFQKTLKCQENITVYKILPREKEKSVDGDRQRDSQDRYVESCVRYTGICGRHSSQQCSPSLSLCTRASPCTDIACLRSNDPSNGSDQSSDGQENDKVLTLAEQFLAAMPDRIKLDGNTSMEEDNESMDCYECCSTFGGLDCMSDDLGIESMADDQSVDFNFEEACHRYRDVGTPSLSPASYSLDSPRSSVQESPISFQFTSGSSPSTAELSEFLQAKCEKDFSNLTLNEREQRELFQAAQIIQKAFRSYKGRKQSVQEVCKPLQEVETEARAAVIIQNYYRRYKQYCYWKRMAKAAVVIQKKYRNYCEHKRFKKSEEAATCIQTYYRNYRQLQTTTTTTSSCSGASHIDKDGKESTPPNPGLKRTFSQRRQNQAARKIQQFMRKSHLNTISEVQGTRIQVGDRSGCHGCRKREAPDSRHSVPAKLSGHHTPGGGHYHYHGHAHHQPAHHHPYLFPGGWGGHHPHPTPPANKI